MHSPRLLPGTQALSSELGGGMTARSGQALSLLPVVSWAPPAGSLPLRVPSRAAATVLTILPASAGQLRGQGAGGVSALPSAGASPQGLSRAPRPAAKQTARPAVRGNCKAREDPSLEQEPCGVSKSVPNSQWAFTLGSTATAAEETPRAPRKQTPRPLGFRMLQARALPHPQALLPLRRLLGGCQDEGGVALKSQASPLASGLPVLSQQMAGRLRNPLCPRGATAHGDTTAQTPGLASVHSQAPARPEDPGSQALPARPHPQTAPGSRD